MTARVPNTCLDLRRTSSAAAGVRAGSSEYARLCFTPAAG
jgi:hypothetical protein